MRITYVSTLLFLVAVFIGSFFIHVNVTTQSRSVVRSAGENTQLVSVVSGRITFIDLENNQVVKRGDTLLLVESDNLNLQNRLKEELLENYLSQLSDLQKLATGQVKNFSQLETGIYQKQFISFQEQLRELRLKVSQAETVYLRYKELFETGVIAAVEFDNYNSSWVNAKASLNSFRNQQISTWQAENRSLEDLITNTTSEKQQILEEKEKYAIIAPINGTVMNYSGLREQSFLSAGQQITEISPDDNLVIESYVLPKDIGFIKENQDVKLQMDAYNYNQWGLATGKVIQIDRNITISDQMSYFRVLSSIDQSYLELKNGYKGEIKKGMTLTARFKLTERTIFQLLYDGVDDWMNPKRN